MLATPRIPLPAFRFPLLPIALSRSPDPEIVIVSTTTGDSYQ